MVAGRYVLMVEVIRITITAIDTSFNLTELYELINILIFAHILETVNKVCKSSLIIVLTIVF